MQPPPGAPRRLIGLVDATALVVGSMIGSGIFIVSAESARLVGTPARLLAVWLVAGLLTLLAANACAELATMFPLAGGPYVFLAGTVVVLLAVASPRTTLPGFGLVLVGIPVFLARRAKRRAR